MKFEKKYTMNQWVKWNKKLSDAIEDFYDNFSIRPNILEANRYTYSQIDFLVNVVPGEKQKLRRQDEITNEVCYPKWNEKVGINQYSYGNCSLEFALDDHLEDKEFVLLYDSDPDWEENENNPHVPFVEEIELMGIKC